MGTDAVIFVVDSADKDRIDDAAGAEHSAMEELQTMMGEDELKGAVLLVLANKQDLPNALKMDEVSKRLGLANIRNHDWFIQGCSATLGEGLYEGLDWLTKALSKRKKAASS